MTRPGPTAEHMIRTATGLYIPSSAVKENGDPRTNADLARIRRAQEKRERRAQRNVA